MKYSIDDRAIHDKWTSEGTRAKIYNERAFRNSDQTVFHFPHTWPNISHRAEENYFPGR